MPSIAQIPTLSLMDSSSPGGKKRKREQISYGIRENRSSLSGMPFMLSTAPPSALLFTSQTNNLMTNRLSPTPRLLLKPRLLKPSCFHDAKRLRISPQWQGKTDAHNEAKISHNTLAAADFSTDDSSTSPLNGRTGYAKIDLSPCHICHQKPKVRTDLDSYGYCEGCEKRTCYICMRECLGPSSLSRPALEVNWAGAAGETESHTPTNDGMCFTALPLNGESATEPHIDEVRLEYIGGVEHIWDIGQVGWPGGEMPPSGHKGMVCSRCSVERGAAGEVRCFGCLRAEECG